MTNAVFRRMKKCAVFAMSGIVPTVAFAVNWTVTDGCASVTADCALSESDQSEIDALTSITIESGKCLYAASGNTVTIPCEIISAGAPTLGKLGAGTLVVAGKMSTVGELKLAGAVELGDGAAFGPDVTILADTGNDLRNVFRFNTVFPADSSLPSTCFQTRAYTTFAFDRDDVFANMGGRDVRFVLGRGSNAAGILDLNGHDQTISTMSFFHPLSATQPLATLERYAPYHQLKSDTAATLTVTNGFVTTRGNCDVFTGRLMGGISFRLDANASSGMAAFSNVLDQVSSTTGSVICASGTVELRNGARFSSLSSIRKEGSGNIEISSSDINSSVELYLDGTGKLTLNSDILVSRAYVNDADNGWGALPADEYDSSSLPAHLAGAGKMTVLYSEASDTVTYTWTGGGDGVTLSAPANWEGGVAPTLDSVHEMLVFPAAGTSSVRVDGEITIGGFKVEYPGSFAMTAGVGALVNLGEEGVSVADTTAQTNTFRIGVPIRFVNGTKDCTIDVGEGTALDLEGELSANAAFARRLVISGGALTLGCAATNLLIEMAIEDPVSLTVTSASGLGAAGATIRSDRWFFPYFTGTRTCMSPWTLEAAFPLDDMTAIRLFPKTGSSFEFQGAVALRGTLVSPSSGKHGGYCTITVDDDLTFRGGLTVAKLARIQFEIQSGATLSFLDNPVVRIDSTSDTPDVRFYGQDAAACRVVTDQSLGTEASAGVIVSRCSLVCAADSCLNGYLTPYVDSRYPSGGDKLWSRIDLAGHSQTIRSLVYVTAVVANRFPVYPDSYVEIASAEPAVFCIGDTSAYKAIHQVKFTGLASFRTASPWTGSFTITNTVSTTAGDLDISSGTVVFQRNAGWAGGTNVAVSGTGVLRMDEGTRAFAPLDGGRPKVALKLNGGGALDIPDASTTVTVMTCETNGVRLARGTYTSASLPGFLTGDGSLHVRSKNGIPGTFFTLR